MAQTTTELNEFKINYLSKAQYQTALANGQINANEFYLTPEEEKELWLHNISIPTSGWSSQSDGTYKYSYSNSNILETSIPQVIWNLSSRKIAMKASIVPVSYAGKVEFVADKLPTAALTVETLIIHFE